MGRPMDSKWDPPKKQKKKVIFHSVRRRRDGVFWSSVFIMQNGDLSGERLPLWPHGELSSFPPLQLSTPLPEGSRRSGFAAAAAGHAPPPTADSAALALEAPPSPDRLRRWIAAAAAVSTAQTLNVVT